MTDFHEESLEINYCVYHYEVRAIYGGLASSLFLGMKPFKTLHKIVKQILCHVQTTRDGELVGRASETCLQAAPLTICPQGFLRLRVRHDPPNRGSATFYKTTIYHDRGN